MKSDYLEILTEFEAEFTVEIERQAKLHIKRVMEHRIAGIKESLRAVGLEAAATVCLVEVWEDMVHGLLPPKIVAKLVLNSHAGRFEHRFDIPVGAFHCPDKQECIFELCMLRAEAQQELRGMAGDGHLLERLHGMREMIASGKIDWSG